MIINKIIFGQVNNETSDKLKNTKAPFLLGLFVSITLLSTSLMASDISDSDSSSIKEALSNSKVVKILSIDGGGIRGVIPLYFLKKLAKEMGQPISSIFDMIAGTSTGGIIALGLTMPEDSDALIQTPKYTPDDLIDLYSQHGDQIFGNRHKKWFNCGGLAKPRYSSRGIEKFSKNLLGDSKLSDTMTDVVITSFETERYKPLVFNSHAAKQKSGRDFLARDVAVGTSAAPTYFKPKKLKNLEGKSYTVIDGGVVMNDPTLMALASAREIYPDAQDFLIVSLGTGEAIKRIQYDSMKRAGGIKWVKPLTSIMMDGAAASVDFQMRQFFPDEYLGQGGYKRRYFRFQSTILSEDKSMDDVSKKHLQSLSLAAEHTLEDREGEMNSLIKLLKEIQQNEAEEEADESLEMEYKKVIPFSLEQEEVLESESSSSAFGIDELPVRNEDLKYVRGKSLLQISTKRSAPELEEELQLFRASDAYRDIEEDSLSS